MLDHVVSAAVSDQALEVLDTAPIEIQQSSHSAGLPLLSNDSSKLAFDKKLYQINSVVLAMMFDVAAAVRMS